MLSLTTIFTLFKSIDIKYLAIGLIVAALGYVTYDYVSTKIDYAKDKLIYKQTIEAYEHTIKIMETIQNEKAISKEKAKTVSNSIKRLNTLKEKQVENINDDNYTAISL